MFFSFAFCTFFKIFHVRLGEKSKSVSFSRVYVCVKAKLTLVSFFLLFYAPSPKNPQSLSSGCAERQLLDGGREISVVCGLVAHKPASRMPQTYRIMPSSSFPIWIYDGSPLKYGFCCWNIPENSKNYVLFSRRLYLSGFWWGLNLIRGNKRHWTVRTGLCRRA